MHQQRRLSPAPSSPLPRSAMIQQHSNRMQFIQANSTPIQYVQLPPQNYIMKTEEHRAERITSRQVSQEKENINVKGFQSMRILNEVPQQQQLHQSYVDQVLKNQREEMYKLFENQNARIEGLQSWQKKLEESEFVEKLVSKQNLMELQIIQMEKAFTDFKEQINSKLTMFQKVITQKYDQTSILKQLEKLREQIGDLYQVQKLFTNQAQIQQQNECQLAQKKNTIQQQQYQQQQSKVQSIEQLKEQLKEQPQAPEKLNSITLDTYDMYIRKYEQFNKQVNDYLSNRKLPEHLNTLLNSSGSEIFDNNDSDTQTKTKIQISDSPIKVLDGTMEHKSVSPIRVSREEIEKIKFQWKMSIIQENENEEIDEEMEYQVDENGYVLDAEGNNLVDNYGNLIQLSEKDIEYFKSKNQLDEIKH